MLFNSLSFLCFLPTVFFLYWFVFRTRKMKNLLVLVCSYFFYGYWDWRFLILIAVSSFVAFSTAILDAESRRGKIRFWSPGLSLMTCVTVNLGILLVFKYYNFFYSQLTGLLTAFGIAFPESAVKLVLPVGISFYTFQALGYNIDVYRQKLEPSRDIVEFFAFISFFPQLVAGPIESANNLLTQFQKERRFDCADAVDGARQMLWGFFKKCVVADNCGIIANSTLNTASTPGGVWLGIFCFSLQIYGDFSGYSDIAIGTSRLFGIKLMRNFAFPYFSRNIGEFWRRWHISLNTWFKNYVYVPLGGSREGLAKQIRNTYVVFLLSGLWHGANWTFIVWGLIHATCFLPLLLSKNNRKYLDSPAPNSFLPSWKEACSMLLTFGVVMLCWVFFRAENLTQAFSFLKMMAGGWGETVSAGKPPWAVCRGELRCLFFFALPVLLGCEWINRGYEHALERLPRSAVLRYSIYYALILSCIFLRGQQQSFIYFQF